MQDGSSPGLKATYDVTLVVKSVHAWLKMLDFIFTRKKTYIFSKGYISSSGRELKGT